VLEARTAKRRPKASTRTFFKIHSPSADRLPVGENRAINCPKGQGWRDFGSAGCPFVSARYGP
jgi:hypothetical protein